MGYTDKTAVLMLMDVLRQSGLEEVVLCPGSRDVPIVASFANDFGLKCWQITDERSAGFFAIGRLLALNSKGTFMDAHGHPALVAVVCTSGSALLNLHPAVAEAWYQKLPLMIISADRPERWIGQMDGQTLPQPGVFGPLVKRSVNLNHSMPEGFEEYEYMRRLVNEAVLALTHHGMGPVHVNIPLDEPLFNLPVAEIDHTPLIKRVVDDPEQTFIDELLPTFQDCPRRMIVIGQMNADKADAETAMEQVEAFARLGSECVIVTEHLGNWRYNRWDVEGQMTVVENADFVLEMASDELLESLSPDLIISMGGHIVSKRLKNFLRSNVHCKHWYVAEDGELVDTYGCLDTVIEASPQSCLSMLNRMLSYCTDGPSEESTDYIREWAELSENCPVRDPQFPLSSMEAVRRFIHRIPGNSVLHLANSSAVRFAQFYELPDDVEVQCNRGVNGIEGSMSAAVGYAAGSGKLNFLIIGDLSFFYDMNAIWNEYHGGNLRILLLNNGGGGIFHSLRGLDMTERTEPFISGNHSCSAKAWAEDRGFIYHEVSLLSELDSALDALTAEDWSPSDDDFERKCAYEDGSRPVIVEVFTNKDSEGEMLANFHEMIKQME